MFNDVKELQVFNNPQFGEIRTLVIQDMPWAVGKDVAIALGYSDTAQAIRKHVDGEDKGVVDLTTPGGIQKVTIINESGLYSLILSSKLPGAKAFKRWVTAEVLPTIRRTGGYSTQGDDGTALRLMEELMRVKEENAVLRLEAAQREIDDLRQQLEAVSTPEDVLERRREKDRERQRRYREKLKQAGQVPGGK